MKHLLIVFFLSVLPLSMFANIRVDELIVSSEDVLSYEVVEIHENCTVVKVFKKDGTFFYNVVAAIATQFIPEAAKALCNYAGGRPSLCDAVYDVSEALVNMRGMSIYKGCTKGIRWIARKGGYYLKSNVSIEAKTYEVVEGLKSVFSAYSYNRCMPYEPAYANYGYCEYENCW